MKKLLASIFIGLVFTINTLSANAAAAPVFDTAKLDNGVFAVSFDADKDVKLKVMVEKGGEKVTYDLKNDGTPESFPLQMGDGEYKVSVLENIEGTRYKYISTRRINLELDDEKQVFLGSVQNINWKNGMKTVEKAAELTDGLKTDTEKIGAIYHYIINSLTYDYDKFNTLDYSYLPDIDNITADGKGICYDYASVFAAMLRSRGIPAKLVKGNSSSVKGYHAWNEVYNSDTGKWIIIDTTYDSQMKEANKSYSMVKNADQYTTVYEY